MAMEKATNLPALALLQPTGTEETLEKETSYYP